MARRHTRHGTVAREEGGQGIYLPHLLARERLLVLQLLVPASTAADGELR